ncbi:MAG TPA: PD-(D/E)XK nuclease family protein [Acidimicrobiales bacterium]|nr:PD-(D/E)XK nuclease family protein [Acidimicrobiales bacterium]
MHVSELNPAQRRVLVELMAVGRDRPRFGADLAVDLRTEIEAAIGPLLGEEGEALWVSKGALGQVHACEAHFQAADGEGFEWNAGNARGTVAHRAVELTLSARGGAQPLDLVDQALTSLGADDPRGLLRPWLAQASELEVADLRAGANDVVAKFLECWPPLKPAWIPRTEMRIGADLCEGRVVLRGKVDLVLGQARGDEARALVVDLKTGGAYPSHLDDLRFYALVQTLRIGVPPFRVASYYLDTATFHFEDVTVETLALAARRAVDGARKLLELRQGRAPGITPGPQCSWCRLADSCEGALSLRH